MQTALNVDILHVISDLHLGGEAGFQIFRCGKEFGRLCKALIGESQDAKVGLVINGDLVDFLAERDAVAFDTFGAAKKLTRILTEDSAFLPVTEGLRKLLDQPNITVVVNLGNHDLELGLPWVCEVFFQILAGSDPTRRSRLILSREGTGIRCAVGHASILCLHGNEVDAWNVTDHEAIRKIARGVARGLPQDDWVPNAGAQLVIAIMNKLKRRYPFIDVLKPETGAVVPILLAIDKTLGLELAKATALLPKLAADDARQRIGWLGASTGIAQPSTGAAVRPDRSQAAAALMRDVERRFAAGETAIDLIGADQRAQDLGIMSAIAAFAVGQPGSEVLRQVLEKLDNDTSFEVDAEDDTFLRIDRDVAGAIDFVVAGHTHLRRAIARRNGSGHYFNTGTWAALMQIRADVRQDPVAFGDLLENLKGQDLDALERKGLLNREPTLASFWMEKGEVFGELRRVTNAGPTFMKIPTTRFRQG